MSVSYLWILLLVTVAWLHKNMLQALVNKHTTPNIAQIKTPSSFHLCFPCRIQKPSSFVHQELQSTAELSWKASDAWSGLFEEFHNQETQMVGSKGGLQKGVIYHTHYTFLLCYFSYSQRCQILGPFLNTHLSPCEKCIFHITLQIHR